MSLFRTILKDVLVWGLQHEDPARLRLAEAESHRSAETLKAARTEKLGIYSLVFSQYWTWKLESLKHLIIVNGFGVTAAATLATASIMKDQQVIIGNWIWVFVAGLYFALVAMMKGSQDLRRVREAHLRDLLSSNLSHPEMQQTRESRGFSYFAWASFACFVTGAAWVVYVVASAAAPVVP